MRIKVKGQVNDSTYVQGRFKNQMSFKDGGDSSTVMDWLYVNHTFGDANVTLGRMPVTIYDGFMFDSTVKGAILGYNKDAFHASVGYGRFLNNQNLLLSKTTDPDTGKVTKTFNDLSKYDAFIGQAGYNFGAAVLDATYIKFAGDQAKKTIGFDSIWSAHLAIPMDEFRLFGEYWDSNAKKADNSWQAWATATSAPRSPAPSTSTWHTTKSAEMRTSMAPPTMQLTSGALSRKTAALNTGASSATWLS